MPIDRLATLRAFIARSPADPFPRYGLAMELRRLGDLPAATTAFDDLMRDFPDYVPTYLMAGGLLAEQGRRTDAARTYRRGIEVSTRKGDGHARSELEAALADLGDPDAADGGDTAAT